MAKKTNGPRLSGLPEDQTSGGAIQGASAVIKSIGVTEQFNYGGRQRKKSCAISVVYSIEGLKKPWEDNHTIGPSDNFEAIDEGYGVRSTKGATGINKQSVGALFLKHLAEACKASDVDVSEIIAECGDGFTLRALEGRSVTLGMVEYEPVEGEAKDKVVITGIGDEASGGKKKGKKAKPARDEDDEEEGDEEEADEEESEEEDEEDDDDPEAITEKTIKGLLKGSPSLKKSNLGTLVYDELSDKPYAKACMQLALKESWIASDDRPWTYDKKKGVLRAAA